MESEFNVILIGSDKPTPSPQDYVYPSSFGKVPPIKIANKYTPKSELISPSLPNLSQSLCKGPKICIHHRPRAPEPFDTPGPNYIPPSFGKYSPRIGFTRARRAEKVNISPGPCDYVYKNNNFGSGPSKTSIHSGISVNHWKTSDSPGPGAYSVKYERIIAKAPSYSIANRTESIQEPTSARLVAPRSTLNGPRWSIPKSGRTKIMH